MRRDDIQVARSLVERNSPRSRRASVSRRGNCAEWQPLVEGGGTSRSSAAVCCGRETLGDRKNEKWRAVRCLLRRCFLPSFLHTPTLVQHPGTQDAPTLFAVPSFLYIVSPSFIPSCLLAAIFKRGPMQPGWLARGICRANSSYSNQAIIIIIMIIIMMIMMEIIMIVIMIIII